MPRQETATTRLDDAARAGWLYYVGGNNQEQIAKKLGVSRQTAQRLVSLSVSEGLVRVRLEHPIGRCMELASHLRLRYALDFAEVVPTDPDAPGSIHGVAIAAATEIEKWLKNDKPVVMAIGTGRTLKSAIEQLTPMEAPQHKIVSLTGSIAPDGSAAFYNVIFNIAEAVKARSFPMPLPVIASSAAERDMLLSQPMIRETHALAQQADIAFVGIGDLGPDAPLVQDGFLTSAEVKLLQKAGAVGEIVGWAFDAQGKFIDGLTNDRVASAPLPSRESSMVVAIAVGERKIPGIRAALTRRLVNGLITDERTAEAILAAE
jgi:DNA-binding transcriptional regulator LsrR (DeoR family)